MKNRILLGRNSKVAKISIVAFSLLITASIFTSCFLKKKIEHSFTLVLTHEDAANLRDDEDYHFQLYPSEDQVNGDDVPTWVNGEPVLKAVGSPNQLVNEGETKVYTFKYETRESSVDMELRINNEWRYINFDVEDGDVVKWDPADSGVTYNPPGDWGNSGSGTGQGGTGSADEDCTNYYYENNQCLSGQGGNAAMRYKACKLSETGSTITARLDFEVINGGIDTQPGYAEGVQLFFGDGTVSELTVAEFNQQGDFSRTMTMNKSDIEAQHLENWQASGFRPFIYVWCQN